MLTKKIKQIIKNPKSRKNFALHFNINRHKFNLNKHLFETKTIVYFTKMYQIPHE